MIQHISDQIIQYQELSQSLYSMPLILYTVLPRQFPCQFENEDNIFQMELVSMVMFELNDYVLIYGDSK